MWLLCGGMSEYLARTIVSPIAAQLSDWSNESHDCANVSHDFERGICIKCDMCQTKVHAGLAAGLRPGLDPAATPACVNACLWEAIHFGDAEDPNSNVSRLLQQNKTFRINEELGTEPSIYYINAVVKDEEVSG